jgi:hypothetical protein
MVSLTIDNLVEQFRDQNSLHQAFPVNFPQNIDILDKIKSSALRLRGFSVEFS